MIATVQIVSYTDATRAGRLAAGIYNAYHAVYPGANSSGFNWAAADSRTTPLADGIFQVLPVRPVAFSFYAGVARHRSPAPHASVADAWGRDVLRQCLGKGPRWARGPPGAEEQHVWCTVAEGTVAGLPAATRLKEP